MSRGAQIRMFLSSGLTPEEEKTVAEYESDIGRVLLEYGIFARPFWISDLGPQGRVVKLVLKEGAVLEMASAEMPSLLRDEILCRLCKNLGVGGETKQ